MAKALKVTQALADYVEKLKEKQLNEYDFSDIAEKIDEVAEMYRATKLKDEKKLLKGLYEKMAEYSNTHHRNVWNKTIK